MYTSGTSLIHTQGLLSVFRLMFQQHPEVSRHWDLPLSRFASLHDSSVLTNRQQNSHLVCQLSRMRNIRCRELLLSQNWQQYSVIKRPYSSPDIRAVIATWTSPPWNSEMQLAGVGGRGLKPSPKFLPGSAPSSLSVRFCQNSSPPIAHNPLRKIISGYGTGGTNTSLSRYKRLG